MGPRDATAKLKEQTGATNIYITRHYFGDYMVSVKDAAKESVHHFKIQKFKISSNKYKFGLNGANDDERFDNVPSLLEYYKDKAVTREDPVFGESLKRRALTRQGKSKYSGTSDKGPSEKGTTSQQRTQFWTPFP